ncbi:MAG TPA: hypothetical protein PLJ27_14345 [Polyangiaceae bacterium]|mgnify:FL=1|jgi:hypothetical protein|nr:MAG: hypothetical protein BWY17_01570 [Deltaproteobacteria bacterium ADurb.Bin207]HNS97748.1 hypothetical protein [Polyangiaceae bacterium]HNZ22766.1 hypothetical protein [Polyangiaceae bacterium]HOD22831.1 hypothetical protein [Polyangiaceae bacterium]HOE47664.1 hypothetical protein [Polyangiaceae bacterium]
MGDLIGSLRGGSFQRWWAFGASVCVAMAGCGGIVAEPEEGQDSDQEESSAPSTGGNASGTGKSAGAKGPGKTGDCQSCEGQPVCAFCLVQSYEATIICPIGKKPSRSGCMSLGERYSSSDGQTVSCHYCR